MPQRKKHLEIRGVKIPDDQQQFLGTKVAESFLDEIKNIAQAARIPTDHFEKTVDSVPTREKLHFFTYEEDGKKKHPTKEALFSKIGEKVRETDKEQDTLIAFCCASLRVGIDKGFDIDHSYPFSKIRQNQEALLACLNAQGNEKFAEAFMATPDIGKYFKRATGEKIKGTQGFFETCYNELGNLIPITHYINREKSDALPQEWVERTFTGKLLEEFRTKNPICDGVILGRIFDGNDTGVSTTFEMAELIEISDDNSEESKGKISGHTHPKNVQGLGEFIIDWFQNNRKPIIERAKDIYSLEGRLNLMLKESMENPDSNQGAAIEKTIDTLKETLNTMGKHYDILSSDGSIKEERARSEGEVSEADSAKASGARRVINEYNLLRGLIYMHRAKQNKHKALALSKSGSRDYEEISENFYDWGIKAGIHRLDEKGIDQAFDYISQELDALKARMEQNILDSKTVQNIIGQAVEKADPRKEIERLKKQLKENSVAPAEEQEGIIQQLHEYQERINEIERKQKEAEDKIAAAYAKADAEAAGRLLEEARKEFYKTISKIHTALNKASGKIEAIQEYFTKHQNECSNYAELVQFCVKTKRFIGEKRVSIGNEGEELEQKTLQEVQETQRNIESIAVEVDEKLREIEKRRPKDDNSEMTVQFRRQQNESEMLGSSAKPANLTDENEGPPTPEGPQDQSRVPTKHQMPGQ